ncbi:hypothetical protein ILYODFUR_031194 [Ilyodon furcidens]|uniref:Uncharacterized protein n=1 Tax=Ilyodon furcidens TaxID=33524 RepID=A0ABV0VA71_9TELE
MGGRQGTPWTGRQSITGQHRQTQDKQPHTHSIMPKGNLEKTSNLTVMFSNPRMHGENMQTPCRKTPGQELNSGPSCCKATVLPTAAPGQPFGATCLSEKPGIVSLQPGMLDSGVGPMGHNTEF